jgi:hypothetical protein
MRSKRATRCQACSKPPLNRRAEPRTFASRRPHNRGAKSAPGTGKGDAAAGDCWCARSIEKDGRASFVQQFFSIGGTSREAWRATPGRSGTPATLPRVLRPARSQLSKQSLLTWDRATLVL